MAVTFYEISPGYGYCLTKEATHATIRAYQEQTQNRFCVDSTSAQFGNIDVHARTRKVFWEDDPKNKPVRESLWYDGVPFFILGRKILLCEFGRVKSNGIKKLKDEKGNLMSSSTKKVDCPALIYIKEVMKFPNYMISEDLPETRSRVAEKLRDDFNEGRAQGERRFYIVFPHIKEHKNHVVCYNGKLVEPEKIPDEEAIMRKTEVFSHSAGEHDMFPGVETQDFIDNPISDIGQHCRDVINELKTITTDQTFSTISSTKESLNEILNFIISREYSVTQQHETPTHT